MPDWFRRQAQQELAARREHEKHLAWSAMLDMATRAPFVRNTDVVHQDFPDYIAQALVDSGPLIASLEALADGVVNPNVPYFGSLVEAATEVRIVADMLPSWKAHCDAHPAPTHPFSNRSQRYIDGPALRHWARAEETGDAVARALETLDRLYQDLAAFYGYDALNGHGAV